MYRNKRKGNRWEASKPTHLIGWDIVTHSYDEDEDVYILGVVSRGSGESRTVYATQFAVPLFMIEKRNK